MKPGRLTRQIALLAGGAAIVGMGALSAGCSSNAKESPSSTTTPSSSAPSPSPTEKVVTPGGGQSFSPTARAVPPGTVCKQIVGGECVR